MVSKTIRKTKGSNKNKTIKNKQNKRVYTSKDFKSGDGMLTSVWGPSLWHYLHILSFNYPIKPTKQEKQKHKEFILNLQYTLPCKYCRENLKKNLKQLPLTVKVLKNRENFSRWVFNLHELINKMLGKRSGLKYNDVRERYEHFRSRCTLDKKEEERKKIKQNNKTYKKEKGCTKPLYGKKSKCVIKIVPQETRCKTFQMDKKCEKKRE
jgi:hypothetical protein